MTDRDDRDDPPGSPDSDGSAWIPLDQNPHADDKREVLDPAGEDLPFKRLIPIALGIGLVVVALVIWLV